MKYKLAVVASILFIGSYFLNFMGCFGYNLSLFTILTSWKFDVGNLWFILAFLAALFGLFRIFAGEKELQLTLYAGLIAIVAGLGVILSGDHPGMEMCGKANSELLSFGFWLLALAAVGMITSHFLYDPS